MLNSPDEILAVFLNFRVSNLYENRMISDSICCKIFKVCLTHFGTLCFKGLKTFVEQISYKKNESIPFFEINVMTKEVWEIEKGAKFNLISANPTKCSNKLKQFAGKTDDFFECVWPFYGVGTWRINVCNKTLTSWHLTDS